MAPKLALLDSRFQLTRALDRSGQAHVFVARDLRANADVIVKLVPFDDEVGRRALLTEFEMLARLADPRLPQVREVGDAGDLAPGLPRALFIAMERIAGETADMVCEKASAEDRPALVAQIVADAAMALAALHRNGLVHHDCKPSHLLRDATGGFRLIDLGLVRAIGRSDGGARGTLSYMSPDALVGARDPAVDLYALGVTAHELLSGRLPYAANDPASLLRKMAEPRTPLAGPLSLVAVIDALLMLDPACRPSGALVVALELTRAGLVTERAFGVADTQALRTGFVAAPRGRAAVLAELERALSVAPVIFLIGGAGSGRTRLVEELDRRRAVAALREGRPRPALLGAESVNGADRMVATLSSLAASGSMLYVSNPATDWLRALIQSLPLLSPGPTRIIAALLPDAAANLPIDAVVVEVPALTADEVAQICERAIGLEGDAAVKAAARLADGRPGALLEVLRAARAHARRDGRAIPVADDLRAVRTEGLAREIEHTVSALGEPSRCVLAATALLERPLSVDELRTIAGDDAALVIGELQVDRLVEWDGTQLRADSEMAVTAAWQGLSDSARSSLSETLLAKAEHLGAWLDGALVTSVARHRDAAVWARRALRALLDGTLQPAHRPSLARLMALAEAVPAGERARLRGELEMVAGDYGAAISSFSIAGPVGDEATRRLLLARALRLYGRSDDAASTAESLVDDARVGHAARVFLARLRSDAGDYAAVAGLLGEQTPAGEEGEAWLEVAGTAALHLGDAASARRWFVALRDRMKDRPAHRRARAEGLLGMTAQSEGALDEAAAAYAQALTLADDAGDTHGAAIYAQNLGGALRELGELGRAHAALERATVALSRVGRASERAMAQINLANLQLTLGDYELVERLVARARADAPSDAPALLYGELLLAELDRRRGDSAAALRRYTACEVEIEDRVLLDAARTETLAELRHMDEARAQITVLARLRQGDGSQVLRLHLAMSEAKARLAVDVLDALPEDLSSLLVTELESAQRGHRRERSLRIGLLLARNRIRKNDGAGGARYLAIAKQAYQEISMRTPELRREALSEDPDIQRLEKLLAAEPSAGNADASLRRLVEINKRLNSELDLGRLLELILDTVIEVSRAERGFLLLRTPSGELEIRCSRNVDVVSADHVAAFSHSIAERSIEEGCPIVTVDASGDQRFLAALSVSDLRLRSVLAVPLSVKGRVVGCVYVDHRARTGLFQPSDVSLVTDLSEQAAIAIENARLLADNRRKESEVRALNAQLERKLESQAVELEGMHREVREARRTLGVRHDYAGLIGQTPRMVELFRLLDRVTDTALPVVIYGESGTGKELVARAIHHNGPRRKAAFVSESCAAIPETLLEAALFGHVRGAFTGAQGERRGLFEIADGGTLFLDEVGEMSPAMQVRLLRVLQEGEFRRVGGEKLLKVDVRVLVASNMDLQRLVDSGRFREDLFYRLNVVRVALPPLRERAADIPLLVEHFLAGREKSSITRGALELLRRYAWPGNVRQLQNEILRAASMAEGAIQATDLSPQVQAGSEEADTTAPGPLDLHERVERLERSLLKEALVRTAGNQSEAARLLGLSRFGLQKKLRRYHLHPKA